jgi:hypothetical protein
LLRRSPFAATRSFAVLSTTTEDEIKQIFWSGL